MKDKIKFVFPRIWECMLYIDTPYIGPVYILCIWLFSLLILIKRRKR